MASVQSTRSSKYACRSILEDEPPDHLESAGEQLIKQLVKKQTDTNVTLEQQLREEKKFEHGIGFVSLDELAAGTNSLQEFEERRERAERLNELEGKGLTKTEALALVTGTRQSKATLAAQTAVIQLLHTPPQPQNHHESGKRQEREVALSVKPDSVETRLYQFAMSNSAAAIVTDTRPPDHPINQLGVLEQSLLHSANPQALARTLRRKRQQQVAALSQPQGVQYKTPERHQSLWDTIESPVTVIKKPRCFEQIATCKKQTLYTIKDGKIVQLNHDEARGVDIKTHTKLKNNLNGQAYVSLQTPDKSPEVSGKLSEDEIKHLPRFQNYDRGKISKTLYIKNLSNNVTEDDLASIFGHFQDTNEDNIIYRLMSGKMRGQAFITFTCCKKATAVLETMNGTILKGKPMVIQYGKQ